MSGSDRVRFDFSGLRVLVTGGSSGIGHGIARAFVDARAHVIITGRRAAADHYDTDLSGFEYHQLEITDASAIAVLAGSLPALDVLVNNAGANLPGGRSEYEPDVFEETVRINLFGAYRMAAACRETLARSTLDGGASVINLASMASYFGITAVPGYGAAKAAIVQLTKTLAAAWAKDGIRVNAVAPGLTRSNMTARIQGLPEFTRKDFERMPLARWGTPEDIAPAVLFLASPAARFITGQTLRIDGGYSIA
ncbi:MAG TPA: SDR family oxidoreductase [Candidatus Kryptonia bacterium]|nr:SDR family oxidoreductase [Candidatus Kryptonia bacterium]